MRFGRFQRRRRPGKQAGYMLLVMLLAAAMLIIALLATAPRVAQQIKRDREEEMIHRGAQYARAVKKYFRKFGGRYPASIDQLESSNNLRFLRKRYKDPMSPKGEWRLVRFGEVQFGRANAIPGAPTQGQSGFGQSSIGNTSFSQGTTGNSGAGLNTTTNSSFGQSDQSPTAGTTGSSGSSTSRSSSGSQSSFGSSGAFGAASTTGSTGQLFGGGAIIGVASTSEAESLKEFDGKNHYNDWKFVYDPAVDRGGLINGPYNPKLAGFTTSQPVMPGAQQPGQLNNPGGFTNTNTPQNQPGSYAPPSAPTQMPK